MTQEFLPKDPAKALVEVKEKMYDRLSFLTKEIRAYSLYGNETTKQMDKEADFLQKLLDIIERS
jgi:hypothetical protein